MNQASPRLTRLIACSAVPEGCAVQVEIEGRAPLAVYRLGDGFYVTDDTCSHGEASLADGEVLPNGEVECPFHGGTFDIRTGEARKYPCTANIAAYPVSIVGGEVWVELEPARQLQNNKANNEEEYKDGCDHRGGVASQRRL